ncbi:exopolysaccharide biosynthesis protein [Amycolatopsis sp. OK19-0408]|uniref:Exopolysaccharide biosynthesis protein n=1 Tax=Amycolatopsis iheyensis TaxID=2945988 RepID=A0A9X2NIC1_9PSEU|nr:exopolysaccharide biosynthesis protein [Amycolatopsis iheyensis]MCR6485340.1 exopolysaccharide biosynthesis protein [Amycolatopsis iheyensis]
MERPPLTDDTVRLALVGQVLRRRWRVLVALAVLGAAVGAGASVLLSPGYQTSSSVLLQGPRQADELLTQAEVATSSVVLDRAAAVLPWHPSGADLQKQITTSVANGNVVKITVSADTAEHAQQLADQVAQQFVKYSGQLASNSADASVQLAQEQRESLRNQVKLTTEKISDIAKTVGGDLTVESVQVRTQLEGLRSSLEQAINDLNQADLATGIGNTVVLGPSERPDKPAAPTMTQLIAGGAVLFFLVGVFGHLFTARADRRLRGEPEIASALGSPILAGVDVTTPQGDRLPAAGFYGKVRRLLGGDRPWLLPPVATSADEVNRDIRYRRVLARLATGPADTLLLVADDDKTGRLAAEQLAELADRLSVPLRVFEFTAARPTVPDAGRDSGVLVVLSAGSRTAWELVRLAEACNDAGQEVVGAVLTHPVRSPAPEKPEPAAEDAPEKALAGSA